MGLGDIRFFFVLFLRGESLHLWAESSKVNRIDVALGTFGYYGLSFGPLPTGWYGHLVPNDPETARNRGCELSRVENYRAS